MIRSDTEETNVERISSIRIKSVQNFVEFLNFMNLR